MLSGKKGNILVLGEFNLPKFTWVDCGPTVKPGGSCRIVYASCEDILNDFNLVQIVTEPTKQDTILEV